MCPKLTVGNAVNGMEMLYGMDSDVEYYCLNVLLYLHSKSKIYGHTRTRIGRHFGYECAKLEAIQRWLAICHVWPWTLTCQKFLLCITSQSQDLCSHQKLNVHLLVLVWERLQTPTMTATPDTTVQPLGRHIANKKKMLLNVEKHKSLCCVGRWQHRYHLQCPDFEL